MRDQDLTAFFLAAILLGCSEEHDGQPAGPAVSYAPREPGSLAVPTHEASFQLLALDGSKRLSILESFVNEAGEECKIPVSGVLVGGFGGTDEWRLTCFDGARWTIWLRPRRPPEVVNCSTPACE